LTGGAYCVLATGSEYVYVITMTDKPVDIVAADYDTNPLFNFYAGLSGDAVQTYARGIDRSFNQHDIALSSLWDGKELCDYVFGELGYNCEYATAQEIKADKAKYIDKLKSYIDRGIPVLQRWVPGPCTLDQVGCDEYRAKYGAYLAEKQASCYSLIVGYEDGGNTILYIDGGIDVEPIRYTTELDVCWDWVFIGGKQREIELSALYKNAMKRTLELLTSPDKYGSSFGAKAFRDWADDVERGVFAYDRRDTKSEYTTYVCVLATNGSAHGHIFSNIAADVPGWKFVSDIIERYKALGGDDASHLSGVWQDLEELGGGFNVTPEVMQDIERRGKIAEKLREAAAHMDEVVRILLDNIHTTH
jgi:hypothetical protein